MRKSVFIALTLAMFLIGANARADFSLNFTASQNLAPGATSTSYTQDIVVTSQYAAEGVTFLPANGSGNVYLPGTTPDQGTIPSGTLVGGATYGVVTSPTSAVWYEDTATQIGNSTTLNTYTAVGTATNPFTNDFIGFNNGTGTGNSYDAGGEIQFSSELSSLNISFSRPVHSGGGGGNHSGTGTNKYIYIDFYNNRILVGQDAVVYGGSASGWLQYTSGGSTSSSFGNTGAYSGYEALNGASFNAVVLDGANPFILDSLSGTSVRTAPIPPTIWLFGAGLLGFLGIKKKIFRLVS